MSEISHILLFSASATRQKKMPPKPAKVRKLSDQHRGFNPEWENACFFTEKGNKYVCLICHARISVFKVNNLLDHYKTHQGKYDGTYSPDSDVRNIKVCELKKSLNKSGSLFEGSDASFKALSMA